MKKKLTKEEKIRRIVRILWSIKNGYYPVNETSFGTKDFDNAKELLEVLES